MQVIVRRMGLFLMIALFLKLAVAVPAEEAEGTDLSGTWKLNPGKSDSTPGMGRGGMGRRGGGGRGRGGGESRQDREMTMVISQEGNVLSILREGGQGGSMEMAITPGEGPQEVSTPAGPATVEAWWQGRELAVEQIQERQTPRGTMTIEQEQTWALSEDGNTLTQQVKLKTPRGDFDMKLVFDRQ